MPEQVKLPLEEGGPPEINVLMDVPGSTLFVEFTQGNIDRLSEVAISQIESPGNQFQSNRKRHLAELQRAPTGDNGISYEYTRKRYRVRYALEDGKKLCNKYVRDQSGDSLETATEVLLEKPAPRGKNDLRRWFRTKD